MQNSISDRLKKLRISAVPTLSIRRMADELGIGHSRYAYFEDPKRFKKGALPIDLTRKLADVLQRYGVDPAEVLKLAGLSDGEVEPEAKKIEAAALPIQYVPVAMALPSEAALKEMFRALLVLVPDGASRDEIASILARRLPVGFAAIGPYWTDLVGNSCHSSDADLAPFAERYEGEQLPRT